jgi:hypothetical protein
MLGLALVVAGYGNLSREGRQPAWHHHLARPMAASLAMVPVCLVLQHWHVILAVFGGVARGSCHAKEQGQHWHVILAVFGGAVTYGVVLLSLGGLHRTRLWRSAFRQIPSSITSS